MSKPKVITPRGATALCPRCQRQVPVHTHRNVKRPVFTDHLPPRGLFVGKWMLMCSGSRALVTTVTNTSGGAS